ncbi:CatB-related O-acetyltransferase [Alteromonas macleodii]|uniref:CatB-related O-acetyltransferase n=1 Tax=Alteromonas macleodii TaxID=28108 RepID=UPI0031403536
MKLKITEHFLDLLTSKRIFLRPHFHHGDALNKEIRAVNIVEAEPYSRIPESSFTWDGKVSIGAFSYVVQGTSLGQSIIGRYCSIGSGVRVMGQSHPTNRVTTSTWTYGRNLKEIVERDFGVQLIQDYKVPNQPGVQIGNDVWVADNVTFKRGIKVHDGAIIAANAVVTKDVPPYAIVAGNPAKIVKFRFTDKIVATLNELQWWNKSPKLISQIDLSNIESFLEHKAELSATEDYIFEKYNLTELMKSSSIDV